MSAIFLSLVFVIYKYNDTDIFVWRRISIRLNVKLDWTLIKDEVSVAMSCEIDCSEVILLYMSWRANKTFVIQKEPNKRNFS